MAMYLVETWYENEDSIMKKKAFYENLMKEPYGTVFQLILAVKAQKSSLYESVCNIITF
jgi:hypothetical protein